MTNHWIDMQHADVVMVMGSNCAENHPLAIRWLQRARERGAIIISVDPRYTRTSAFADMYTKVRSGTDIAFVGGMINYALENDRIHKEYVVEYTNAPMIIKEGFDFDDGIFSGYDPKTRAYDKSSWAYELDNKGVPKRDKTLQHPRSVYQLLKKHYARYTADKACRITGTPKDEYLKVCDTFTSTFTPDKVATWLYAMGTTQHTHGTQNIRSYVILQLLMGNIGRAGGGINALRGESNVQGSTDMCLLYHIIPGYLKSPHIDNTSLKAYLDKWTPKTDDPMSANWWGNYSKYVVSLLKAWWGDKATAGNDFAYDYLPKRSGNYSHISLFERMYDDKIDGLFCFGQNPAVGGPNAEMERSALGKLDWLVAVDLWDTETASFWQRPGVNPVAIDTEVFLLPAAASMEKEGSVTNSGRWMQWRYQAVPPPGMARTDAWILDRLAKAVKKEYASGGAFPAPIVDLNWEYGLHEEPDVHMVAKEVNGYFTRDTNFPKKNKSFKKGDQVPSFAWLKNDGSTASGNWLYCGSFTDKGNMAARRTPEDAINKLGLYPQWAWCWPVNRRIIYNRASVDPQGKPWDPNRWVIRWNAETKKWEGDVPDGGWAPGTKLPFIMRPEGVGCIFSTSLADGPLPEHYEPLESPVNNLMSSQQSNPAIKIWATPGVDRIGSRKEFPIVATTYRVSEHWQAGCMTRNLPWLVELVPDSFVEIGTDLAKRKGIEHGDRVVVSSARGKAEAYALVTERFEPFDIDGKRVDQIGLTWHFGYCGLAKGDSANVLTPHVGDANTMIPEFKAFLCDVEKKV